MTGSDVPEADRSVSPGAARRQLGNLLRILRDRVGLRLDQAGDHIQRSTATLSRLENGKSVPRRLMYAHCWIFMRRREADAISQDERDRVMLLAADSRQQAWLTRSAT